jgi:hypothetical protein
MFVVTHTSTEAENVDVHGPFTKKQAIARATEIFEGYGEEDFELDESSNTEEGLFIVVSGDVYATINVVKLKS